MLSEREILQPQAWPGVPGPPGRGPRGSGGEGPGTRPDAPQLSQRGQEAPRAELLSPGVCTGRGAGVLAGDTERGRGDRASAAQRDCGTG